MIWELFLKNYVFIIIIIIMYSNYDGEKVTFSKKK